MKDKLYKKGKRGFAAMNPERQKEIAAMGGRAAHEKGVAYKFDSKTAKRAGMIGGSASRRSSTKKYTYPRLEGWALISNTGGVIGTVFGDTIFEDGSLITTTEIIAKTYALKKDNVTEKRYVETVFVKTNKDIVYELGEVAQVMKNTKTIKDWLESLPLF